MPESPQIDSQDLEHDGNPDTRVNTKGVRIKPPKENPESAPAADTEDEEKARESMTQVEANLRKLPPG
jgi:hypothetical protein